jgi:hypothetical protein
MRQTQLISIAIACGALPCLAQNGARVHHVGTPVRQTIAPAKMEAVSVETLPNAVCTLQGRDDSGATRTLRLYANDQGRVRFHARAESETDNPARLDLQCETDGQVMQHGIELRAAAAAANAGARAAASARSGRVRPALSGDPLLPSRDELVSRGYPARPDPVQAPEAYATWLRVVSSEANVIEAKTVLQPDRSHGPIPISPIGTISRTWPTVGNSNNWSGFGLHQDTHVVPLNPSAPYDWVSGEWYVPSVTGELFIQDDSSLWVGLDGLTSNDVLQDGTEQQAFGMSAFGAQWTIATYYAWVEFFPLGEQLITNFDVNPGDHLLGQVWLGNAGSGPTMNGAFGVCLLYNLTTNTNTIVYIPIPAGVTFTGSSAEWIMERPTVNGALPDLSNYGAAWMWNAYAERSNGTVVNSNGNPYADTLTMVNGSNRLSTVFRINDTAMLFSWIAFR